MMERVKLGEICEIVSGSTPKTEVAEYWDGDIDWITPAELTDETYIIEESQRKITHAAVQKNGLRSFPKGTVILSSRAPIGKVAIAGKELFCNQGFKNLICSEKIDNRYLYWYLKGHKDYLNSLGRGATFKEISKAIVENIEIPLPNLDTQISCSDILKKCWDLISTQRVQIEAYNILIKSRFVEMFGDPNNNPLGWDECMLSSLLTVIGGYAFKSDRFKEIGIPVLRIGNINSGYFVPTNMVYWPDDSSLNRYKIYPGDLVVSLTGTVGKDDYGNVCILGNDYDVYYLNQRNAKLELSERLDKNYLSELLKYPEIKKRLTGISRGVRQANISNKDILNLNIPVPPISLQKQFATFVHQVDKLKVTVQKSLTETQLLFDSLMQQYFG